MTKQKETPETWPKRAQTIWATIAMVVVALFVLTNAGSGDEAPRQERCDSNYRGACVPVYPPDVDCGDLSAQEIDSIGSDPHGLEGNDDGGGCES